MHVEKLEGDLDDRSTISLEPLYRKSNDRVETIRMVAELNT